LIKKCETCEIIPELHLPTPNEFIPTDFHLYSKESSPKRPQLPTKIKVQQYLFLISKIYLYSRKMNSIDSIMAKIHSINYQKRTFILNFESKGIRIAKKKSFE
jgi:secreted Zn-dependent insulinase-like peptidase